MKDTEKLKARAPYLLATLLDMIDYVGCADEPACNREDKLCYPCTVRFELVKMGLIAAEGEPAVSHDGFVS